MKEEDSATTRDQLVAQVQKLEVACSELKSLPSGRSVYQKRGSIFFRTESKLLTAQQQRELKKVKNRLDKLQPGSL